MKKGIIVASFGTSFPDIRERCIESVENAIEKAFPDRQVNRAFTSNMIIKKLKERDNIHIDTPREALDKMIEEGFTEIHVQPLHVIPGFEYDKVKTAVSRANHKRNVTVTIGKPLMSQTHHYDELIDAVMSDISFDNDEHALVLMGHGTHHHANACYSMLQSKLSDKVCNVFVSNVEGYPELNQIMGKLERHKKITLMPLMLVAGDHAINDMAGDDDDSFKNILISNGKEVECVLKGLGENQMIQHIFINRIKEVI